MANLKRKVLSQIDSDATVVLKLKAATEKGGWLHKLGAYRDLVLHSAPLARAQGMLFAYADKLPLDTTGALPSLKLPVPEDPVAISRDRATGKHFDEYEEQYRRFIQATHGEIPTSDGLAYAHQALARLTDLAIDLGLESPVPPERPHITEKDIVGPVKIVRR